MKKSILIIVYLVSSISISSFSQGTKVLTIEEKAIKSTEKLNKTYTLTKDQFDQIKTIYIRKYTNIEKANEAIDIVKRDKSVFESELQGIFTKEQLIKFMDIKTQKEDSIQKSKLPPWKR